jgi:DNA-binding NarL/FixJ family response regulator
MSTSLNQRTAVLVDQHPLWMETVEQVLGRAGIRVVGKHASSTDGLEAVEEVRPDLLVTGLMTADSEISGVTLIRHAGERVPGLKIVVFSMFEDFEHIDSALAAGADAYVLKTAHPEDLTSAVRQVFQHSIFLAGVRSVEPQPVLALAENNPGLTRRELEILRLVAEGHSNAQLARMLWVTEQTVKFHLSNIYRKLDVGNRTEASRWAQLNGMLASQALPVAVAA